MELALGQKGPAAPPPKLDQPFQVTALAVAGWDDVVAATHWHLYQRSTVDGVDFYVNGRELGHIHLNGWVHLATNHHLCKLLLENDLAEAFPYAGYEHWIMFRIQSATEAEHAIWLFHLNYFRLLGHAEQDLLSVIEQYPTSNPNQPE